MSENRTLRVIAAAGGTGGHLFPAIAAVQELEKITGRCEAQFIGTSTRIESRIVPELGYKLNAIPIVGFAGLLKMSTLLLPFRIFQSTRICRKIIKNFKPDVVICTGAYISYPAGVAAYKMGVPLVLMESNVSPGKTISLLAPKASLILTSFEESAKYFPPAERTKISVCGNPVRAELLNLPDKHTALAKFGLEEGKLTILIFGGSLGARSMNLAIEKMLSRLSDKGYQVIWQIGKNFTAPEKLPESVKVLEFIDDMASAYSASDLVVSRSGATTLAELCVVGKPSILIPLRTASNNEQEINGRLLDESGAALIISDAEIADNDELLFELISEHIEDSALLETMASSAKALSKPNAANDCANEILKLVNWGE